MKFVINGKDYGDQNVDLLINYDCATEVTELQFFGNGEENILNSNNCKISEEAEVSSEDDIGAMYEDTFDLKSSAITAVRAANIIKRELVNMEKRYDKLYENYLELCAGIMKNQGESSSK